ncbi:hypothetical protein [Prosthecobacter dejongeii]|uniref:Tetratricopeptide (TPR) repeat protein n=1 Tax=Prosthecobacter dejongeii TaxID=48465 RepID=A0A7W7YNN3_9BACT|nr:hypothetical protein [Prosthecobacter dejongeii]MBB5039526.1 tetratricopeptide (TPR) repeat protein [Prosthecobacter dejongeii]
MPPPSIPDQAHAEANQWTLHGIDLLERGDRDALLEAQACFEQAISLRQFLPLDSHPLYRWGLTAGWMNRADVLTRLGGPARIQEALRSYDIAIAHLHQLPLETNPLFRWRLSLAWMNRGLTLQAFEDESSLELAIRHFDTAIQVMQCHEDSPRADYQQVQAAAWMNRASTLLRQAAPDWALAAASARRALHHCLPGENTDSTAAEIGIKARHTLCRALAHLLETPPVDATQADNWIHEATDAVEDIMRLTSHETRFIHLREEIFHFGCRIYRAFQPHFLAEFLDDGLNSAQSSTAMTQAARESITLAALQIQQESLSGCTPARLDRLILTLQSLSDASVKLGIAATADA